MVGGYIKERLSQWVLVSSRPLHLARWDFVYTHVRAHMRTYVSMQRQMTINGYNNAMGFFFLAAQPLLLFLRTVRLLQLVTKYNNLMPGRANLSGTGADNIQSKLSDTVDVVSGNV